MKSKREKEQKKTFYETGKKNRKSTMGRKTCMAFLFLIILQGLIAAPVYAKGEVVERKTVKIGFFESEGYHQISDDDTMSGYGFDFLQMLLRYNDWSYEYLGYDNNWGDMLAMLDSGEIDMVTLADKTPERMDKYVYSKEPIGTSSSIMTMNAENEEIIIGDYKTYDGKRAGLVKGSSHNAGFEKYAKEHGFTYKPVYYENIDDLLADLRAGVNIDYAVTSNMRQTENETIMDEFDSTDYYAIVKKGNEDLITNVDKAMAQLDVYSQNWRESLFKKYYSNINENAIPLSTEERQYIKDLKSSHTVIKAVMNPELKPYSYFEDGKAKGIVPRIFKEIAARLDIDYEILPSKDRWEYKEQLSSGEADIDLTAYMDYGIAQKYNLKETNAYLETSLAMITKKNTRIDMNHLTVASMKDPTEYMGYNSEFIDKYKTKEYTSIEDCIQAVKDEEADAYFTYVYIAEQAVIDDYQNKLQYNTLQNTNMGLCIGVVNQEDHRMLSVLNKAVDSLSDSYTENIMVEQSTQIKSSMTMRAFFYSNPIVVLGGAVLILLGFFLCIYLIARNRHQKNELLSSIQFERFLTYVCECYDQVEEINLVTQQKVVYEIEEGQLVKHEMAYVPYKEEYFREKVHEEDLQRISHAFSEETIRGMFSGGIQEQNFDCQVKNAQGDYRWYSYIIKVVPKDQVHPENFIIFKKDIQMARQEEEKKNDALKTALENAKQASKAKGLFVSKISHEIRTPLNAIIGYLNIADENPEDIESVKHCIHNGISASSHLLDLINDVLDLSAIESNKMKIAEEAFDLKEVITSISSIYYSQSEREKKKFQVDILGLTEERVVGDGLRLKQILMNLLSNAVKFTEEGGQITLRIEQMKQTNNRTHIRFIVSDTGIGMDAEYLTHIFDAFEQETASIARKYGGSGLGLSITKNLLELMDGSIEVESKKNEGTTFTVALAFGRCAQQEEEMFFDKVRILVVESDKMTAKYIKSLLKRCHVKCDIAETKEKAIKRILGRKGTDYAYNVCLVDDTCEDLGGRDICKSILETQEDDALAVAAISYDANATSEAALALGVKKVIEKPLFQSSMVDLLMELYGKEYEKQEKDSMDTEKLRGLSVLLAEDNEMNMEISLHILEKEGVKVTQAVDGREACDIFFKEKPGTFQFILMDIQMPYMDGYEATKTIRQSNHPDAKTIPIIALTANAFSEDISKALTTGMNDHIAKPVSAEKLLKALM